MSQKTNSIRPFTNLVTNSRSCWDTLIKIIWLPHRCKPYTFLGQSKCPPLPPRARACKIKIKKPFRLTIADVTPRLTPTRRSPSRPKQLSSPSIQIARSQIESRRISLPFVDLNVFIHVRAAIHMVRLPRTCAPPARMTEHFRIGLSASVRS